ncbi:MAG: hypothetical protein L3J46_06715 [Kangiellaceae bacterium]|nr:hypothetical protein [Kangiellaceae bacterium]
MIKKLKKILIRSVIYLVILLGLPYLYFVWQAKQGVDAFIVSFPLGGSLEYEWLLVDLDGNISLYGVALYQQSNEPLFEAQTIVINYSSIFDLVDLQEHILYREFPARVTVNIKQASSSQAKQLAALLGVNYPSDLLTYLYPLECHHLVEKELPFINFDLKILFDNQQTADISRVRFGFNSIELAELEGSFKINNFTQIGVEGGFISDLSINAKKLAWIQQNTQKCLADYKLSQSEFRDLLKPQLNKLAKNNQYLLSNLAATALADFLYVPQTMQLEFQVQEGKNFGQIAFLPMHQYQQQTGLKIKLNLNPLGTVFQEYEPPKAIARSNNVLEQSFVTPANKDVSIRVSRSSLITHLGAKLKLKLRNETEVIGYLEHVDAQSVKIRQLKYKGESVLPFALADIKSILMLRTD